MNAARAALTTIVLALAAALPAPRAAGASDRRARRSLLPARRQRRLRRRALRARRSTTTPATDELDGDRGDPRRARRRRSRASISTCAASTSRRLLVDGRPRVVHRRAGQELHRHAAPGAARRARRSPCSSRYAGMPRGDHRPRRLDRGLGARPTTAPSSSASRRARRAGTRPTTTRATRRRSTSPSPCPPGSRRWPTASSSRRYAPGRHARPGSGTRRDPMAPYLATATLGRFDLTRSHVDGIPSYVAVDPQLAADAGQVLDELPGRSWLLQRRSTGRIRSTRSGRSSTTRPDVGYSLETQTKPNFDRRARRDDARPRARAPVVRRLRHAHASGPTSGCTRASPTWSEWIWAERHGGQTAQQSFKKVFNDNDPAIWDPPPGRVPSAAGAVQRHGLRPRGDDAAGAARQGRRRHLLPHPARLVRPAPLRQRDDRRLHRPRRARLAPQPGRVLPPLARQARPGRNGRSRGRAAPVAALASPAHRRR